MNTDQITAVSAEQITNIAIKVGEASQQAQTAIWVAIISGICAIIAAIVAGYFKWKMNAMNQAHEKNLNDIHQTHEKRLNEMDKEHEKQWAFINRRVELIDKAIEISWRMIFNKLAIEDFQWKEAHENLFILQKEAWVIESLMAVYSSPEIVDAFADLRSFITTLPPNEIRIKWNDIIDRGRNCLLLCRTHIGREVSEKFDEFTEKLVMFPPLKEEVEGITAGTSSLGGLSLSVTPPQPKIITEQK